MARFRTTCTAVFGVVLSALSLGGCSPDPGQGSSDSSPPPAAARAGSDAAPADPAEMQGESSVSQAESSVSEGASVAELHGSSADSPDPPIQRQKQDESAEAGSTADRQRQPPRWSEPQLLAFGVRQVVGEHVTVFTDLPASAAIDELSQVFDLAIPQWCEYFEVPAEQTGSWRLNAYLMLDKEKFKRIGMLPDDLPPFLHGFQRDSELWLYEQPSAYYRRHLLLHEGTHGFMHRFLGGTGPPWYMEGVAELLATHRWENGILTLNYFPQDKQEVSHWGRIKKIREKVAEGQPRSLGEIMQYDRTAHLEVAPYAWSWAAAAFFDNHPAYRKWFRGLKQFVEDPGDRFSQRFYEQLEEDWPHAVRQWQLFVVNMDYGYDVSREAIEKKEAAPVPAEGATVKIAADRGWQSTGFRLTEGQRYRIEATGRYQIAKRSEVWWCEPNGVTIRFYNGLPLGILLGALVDEQEPPSGSTRLRKPTVLAEGGDTRPERGGTLYLRVNDSPAELEDNGGEVAVRLEPAAPADRPARGPN